jgi:hypothetical protein
MESGKCARFWKADSRSCRSTRPGGINRSCRVNVVRHGRIAGKHHAVLPAQGDEAAGPQIDAAVKLLEIALPHRSEDQAEKAAVRRGKAMGEINGRRSRAPVQHRRANELGAGKPGGEGAEIVAIRHIHIGDRPIAREVQQLALGADDGDGIDLRQAVDALSDDLVHLIGGGGADKAVRIGRPEHVQTLDQAALDLLGALEGTVGLFRQGKREVLELTMAIAEGAVPQIDRKYDGRGKDGDDEGAAKSHGPARGIPRADALGRAVRVCYLG